MAAALTLMAKERGDVAVRRSRCCSTRSPTPTSTPAPTRSSRTGYFLRRDGMQWFWDQYTTDAAQRAEITASPLRATTEQLAGLPPALVITGEADVLRDEGEAYANKLRAGRRPGHGGPLPGIIHDFVMLNALRDTHAAEAAIRQAIAFLSEALAAR